MNLRFWQSLREYNRAMPCPVQACRSSRRKTCPGKHVPHGIGGQGGSPADRAGDENRLGLTLHPATTLLVDLRRGREGFVFLGCAIRKKRSIQRNPRLHFMQRWPSPKATKKLRGRIREITSKRQSGKEVKQLVAELTPVLRGWGNYFRTGNADRKFNQMDSYVVHKLRCWQYRRGGQRPTKRPPFTRQQLYGMGLHRLMGRVGYPSQATPRRSSVSRVPETARTVCKGVTWYRAAPRRYCAMAYQ